MLNKKRFNRTQYDIKPHKVSNKPSYAYRFLLPHGIRVWGKLPRAYFILSLSGLLLNLPGCQAPGYQCPLRTSQPLCQSQFVAYYNSYLEESEFVKIDLYHNGGAYYV